MMDPRTPVDEIAEVARALADLQRKIDLLEAPTGTSAFRAVDELTALVNDIQAQLDVYNASRWTNADITAQINAAIAAAFAGNVTIGGTLTANGAITFPNVPSKVFGPEPRTVVWVDTSTGRIGRT